MTPEIQKLAERSGESWIDKNYSGFSCDCGLKNGPIDAYLAGFQKGLEVGELVGRIAAARATSEVRVSPEKAHFWHYKEKLKDLESELAALLKEPK